MQHITRFNASHQHTIRGIYWVFAGVAAITTWQFSPLSGSAATTTTPDVKTTATDNGQQTTDQSSTVTLKPATTPSTTQPVTKAPATDDQQPTTPAPKTESDTDPKTEPKPVTTTPTVPVTDSTKPAAPKTDVTTPNQEPKPTTVVPANTGKNTDPIAPKTTAKVPSMRGNLLRAAVPAPDIANSTTVPDDTVGTAWRIDNTGTLHLAAGTLNTTTKMTSPWTTYQSQIKKVSFDGPVTTVDNASLAGLFNGLSQVTTIDNLTDLDTSKVTDMSDIFQGMTALTTIDVSKFDTDKVIRMTNMFSDDSSLSSLNVSGFKTENVQDMSEMFAGLDSLTSLDVSNFDTRSVGYDPTNSGSLSGSGSLDRMFMAGLGATSKLTSLTLPVFDLSHVTSMQTMFENQNQLTSLKLASVNHGTQAINMVGTVSDLKGLTSLDLSDFQMLAGDTLWQTLSDDPILSTLKLGPQIYLTNTAGDPVGLNSITGQFLDQWTAASTGKVSTTDDLLNLYGNDRSTAVTETYTHTSFFNGKKDTVIAGPKTAWSPLDSITILDNFDGSSDLTQQSFYTVDGNTYNAKGEVATPGLQSINVTPTITDATGQTVDYKQLDLSKPGNYTVHYSAADSFGNVMDTTGSLEVVASKATVLAKNTPQTIVIGPKQTTWQAADNFASATDANGNPLTLKDLTYQVVKDGQTGASQQLDTTQAGTYVITYTYTDQLGNPTSADATVIVKATATSVDPKQTETSFFAGNQHQNWSALANLATVKTADGQVLDPADAAKDVTVDYQFNGGAVQPLTDQLDTTRPGTYLVTYHLVDTVGNSITATTKLVVKASAAKLAAKSASFYAGTHVAWTSATNFLSGSDELGQPITATNPNLTTTVTRNQQSRMLLSGMTVNTQVPGDYLVTYTYTDADGNTTSATGDLTLKPSAAKLTVQPASISYSLASQPQLWQATDSFRNGTLANGQPMTVSALSITFDQKPVQSTTKVPLLVGKHTITYTYLDPDGNPTTATTTLDVLPSQASLALNAADVTIATGTNWSPLTNFDKGTNATGKALTAEDLTITYTKDGKAVTTPDLTQPGTYQVSYRYTDASNNQIVKTSELTVQAATIQQPGHVDVTTPTTPDQPVIETPAPQPTNVDQPTTPTKATPVVATTAPVKTPVINVAPAKQGAKATQSVAKPVTLKRQGSQNVSDSELAPAKVDLHQASRKSTASAVTTHLPQTDEQSTISFSLLGLLLGLLSSFWGFVTLNRKHN
ncbi:BspA family leucine-rich repeat surface protein [Lactiplantibacillus songbeiensis]|uniref:BspA family leucine-rich repeat surface protein n=1 Tax=Lactiplantibacillus songbeiensis TaxID=2559920 RepID=A0ABW4C1V8_9LACO|nr:BspA family leucine-rich repeat surface protein [Lactiplantibacillus songbeiensis]